MGQRYEKALCDLRTSHSAQISQLKQLHCDQIEEIRKEAQNEKNALEKEQKISSKTNALQYDKLKNEFDELNAAHFRLENMQKNQAAAYHDLQQEYEENKELLATMKQECKALDLLKFENEKKLNENAICMAALQQQIKDKGEIAMNNSNLLASEQSAKQSMLEQLALYKQNCEKQEKKVKECIKEINKGNSIISHLQNEIRNQRQKNKLKEAKLSNLEQANSNKSDGMNRLTASNTKQNEEIERLKKEAKEYKNTLLSCKEKLQESQKAIESNQRVIAYLNKQLNDNQMSNNIFSHQSSTMTSAAAAATNKYTSPYLTKIGQQTAPISTLRDRDNANMSGHGPLSGLGTTISPILNNNNSNRRDNRPTPPSSYFPQ